jgi:lysophospholipase L1-like esterase
MIQKFTLFRLLIAAALILSFQDGLLAQDPERWEETIRQFEQQDRQNPPPKGAVLFAGSSSIRMWESLQDDFPDLTTINRGFGGSQMSDLNHYIDRIVLPYEPSMIFVYEGDNDIAAGKSPEEVRADFRTFVERIHSKMPDTPIGFIAIKPSTARLDMVNEMRRANELIKEYTLWKSNLEFIDIFSAMLGPDGYPREELLLDDGLHMTGAGYEVWTKIITPYIQITTQK